MLGFCRHDSTQWSLDALNFHYTTNSNFWYLDVVNFQHGTISFFFVLWACSLLFSIGSCTCIQFGIFSVKGKKVYRSTYKCTSWRDSNFIWHRRIDSHICKLPHTGLMFCINRFKFKDPMFCFSFFISIASFQVTWCTWGISSITLDPMGFVPHIGSAHCEVAQADPKHPATKSYCKACVERKICTENVLGSQLHPNQKETELLNWAYSMSWANFKQDKWIRWGKISNRWFRVYLQC